MSDRHYPTLRETRRRHILSILERTGWDIKKASILLKVSERYVKNEIKKMAAGGIRSGGKQ